MPVPARDGDDLTNPYGCARYRSLYWWLEVLEADTHHHIHKENNLIPAALRLEDG